MGTTSRAVSFAVALGFVLGAVEFFRLFLSTWTDSASCSTLPGCPAALGTGFENLLVESSLGVILNLILASVALRFAFSEESDRDRRDDDEARGGRAPGRWTEEEVRAVNPESAQVALEHSLWTWQTQLAYSERLSSRSNAFLVIGAAAIGSVLAALASRSVPLNPDWATPGLLFLVVGTVYWAMSFLAVGDISTVEPSDMIALAKGEASTFRVKLALMLNSALAHSQKGVQLREDIFAAGTIVFAMAMPFLLVALLTA